MIKTIKHLCYALRSSEEELYFIVENIDSYYYYARQAKIKYGEVQREKDGRIRYRDLYPSKGRLKEIQKRINRILQDIKLPEYAYGSVKQKSNILNALKHQGNTHLFSIDL